MSAESDPEAVDAETPADRDADTQSVPLSAFVPQTQPEDVVTGSAPTPASGDSYRACASFHLGFEERPDEPAVTETVAEAREVDWVVSTGRYPFAFDSARLGFGIGFSEESDYQWTPDEVSLPVHFLDNDYRNADLERFVERAREVEPEVAVIGDIYDADDLDRHLEAANDLWADYPDMELIIVPKTADILHEIPEEFVVGYPNGVSDIQGRDIASIEEWRSIDNGIHILGGTPLQAYDEIVALTEYYIAGPDPADIVGLDSNNAWKYAQNRGDYADATGGWHRNLRTVNGEYTAKRDLILYAQLNVKHFWISKGVWPNSNVDDLQLRDTLQEATKVDDTISKSKHMSLSGDARELAATPIQNGGERTESSLLRTDETQAVLTEPLAHTAALLVGTGPGTKWEPTGSLSGETEYSAPNRHYDRDKRCVGCGKSMCGHGNEPVKGDSSILAYLVSYYDLGDSNHVESTAQEGRDTMDTDAQFSNVQTLCSETCRKQVEMRCPDLLIDDGKRRGRVDGEVIATVVK